MEEYFGNATLYFLPTFNREIATVKEQAENVTMIVASGPISPNIPPFPKCEYFDLKGCARIPDVLELPECLSFVLSDFRGTFIPSRPLETLKKCTTFVVETSPRLSFNRFRLTLPACRKFFMTGIKSIDFETLDLPECISFKLDRVKISEQCDLSTLKNSKSVVLSQCDIENFTKIRLPKSLECQTLDVSANPLTDLDGMPGLSRCKEVLIYDTNIPLIKLQKFSTTLNGENTLIYGENTLTAFEKILPELLPEITDITQEAKLLARFVETTPPFEQLDSLDLIEEFTLDGWPHHTLPEFLLLKGCKTFRVKNTQIKRFSNRLLDSLKECRVVALKNNPRFKGFPANIGFSKLESFKTINTPLHYLSRRLAFSFESCSLLTLSNAAISLIPNSIRLDECTSLDLSDNSLSFLPAIHVPEIVYFDLSFNQIKHILDLSLDTLRQCQVFKLSYNPLVGLDWFPSMPRCREVHLEGLKLTERDIDYVRSMTSSRTDIYGEIYKGEDDEEEIVIPSHDIPNEVGVLKCINVQESISQEEWGDDFAPDIFIWKGDEGVLCYDSESLSSWLKNSNNVVAKWVAKPGKTIDDMGFGGAPSSTERYGQIYDVTSTSAYPIFVSLNSVYRALKKRILKDVLIKAEKVDRVRVGNVKGTFGISGLHGQLPEVDIYDLEVMGSVTR